MIRAGARLLSAQGYEATALLDVTDAAGASRGSIYFHFPNGKQQLAEEAVVYSTNRALEGVALTIQRSESTADAVQRTYEALASALTQSDFSMGCPVATIALETAATNEPLRLVSEHFFVEWRSLYVGSLLRDGFDHVRAQRLATMTVATIEGGLMLARTLRSTDPLTDTCAEVVSLLTR